MHVDWTACANCGNRIPPSSRFCDQCGNELKVPDATSPIMGEMPPPVGRIPSGWSVACATDPGLVRKQNEDAYSVQVLDSRNNNVGPSVGLGLVADGMGGAAAGEVASRMGIEGVSLELTRYLDNTPSSASEPHWELLIKNAVAFANHEIYAARQIAHNDMGTTLVGAILLSGRAIVINVGDSRAYHISRNAIRRVSKDHSLVQSLVDSGHIALEEMRTHPQRNLIMRSLGGQPEVISDVFTEDLLEGEWLLLCTDGLWEMVTDQDIQRIVSTEASPESACRSLVEAAKQNGGHDNITLVLCQSERGFVPESKGRGG